MGGGSTGWGVAAHKLREWLFCSNSGHMVYAKLDGRFAPKAAFVFLSDMLKGNNQPLSDVPALILPGYPATLQNEHGRTVQ